MFNFLGTPASNKYTVNGITNFMVLRRRGFFMKSSMLFMSLLIVVFFSGYVDAASTETLTWDDCLSKARADNPDLASSYESLLAAKADRTAGASGLWPEI